MKTSDLMRELRELEMKGSPKILTPREAAHLETKSVQKIADMEEYIECVDACLPQLLDRLERYQKALEWYGDANHLDRYGNAEETGQKATAVLAECDA